MSLASGTKLGPYGIVAPLGAGWETCIARGINRGCADGSANGPRLGLVNHVKLSPHAALELLAI